MHESIFFEHSYTKLYWVAPLSRRWKKRSQSRRLSSAMEWHPFHTLTNCSTQFISCNLSTRTSSRYPRQWISTIHRRWCVVAIHLCSAELRAKDQRSRVTIIISRAWLNQAPREARQGIRHNGLVDGRWILNSWLLTWITICLRRRSK